MCSNVLSFRALAPAVFGLTASIATYTAYAQESGGIVVEATRPSRSSTTGAPIKNVTAQRVVSYSDISLTTASGVKVLETRIRDAARSACGELEAQYPVPAQGDSTQKCVDQAIEGAMVDAHKRIDAAAKPAGVKKS
jgi:UrcA family protein